MICILEDDDNIREIENFALKNCGFVTEPGSFCQRILGNHGTQDPPADLIGYHAAGRGWYFCPHKIKEKSRVEKSSGYPGDGQDQ